MNKAILVGRISQIKESKTYDSGSTLVQFNVCTSESFKKNGEWVKEPTFHTIKSWNKTANYVEEHLRVGDMVTVEGQIKVDSYEKDGVKKQFNYISLIKIARLQKSRPKENQNNFESEKDQGDILQNIKEPEINTAFASEDIPF